MGLIHHSHEDLLLDQPLGEGEGPPLDLDLGVPKASSGRPAEDPTLGGSTRDEQLKNYHEDLKTAE